MRSTRMFMNIRLPIMSSFFSNFQQSFEILKFIQFNSFQTTCIISLRGIFSQPEIDIIFIQQIIDLFIIYFKIASPNCNISLVLLLLNIIKNISHRLNKNSLIKGSTNHGMCFTRCCLAICKNCPIKSLLQTFLYNRFTNFRINILIIIFLPKNIIEIESRI